MEALALDTELLVLLVVGTTAPSYIEKHKRLTAYREADFDLLKETTSKFAQIIVTPNVLSETSNFLGYITEPIRSKLYVVFRTLIDDLREDYIKSIVATRRDEFIRLGLTDATLMEVNKNGHVLLTSDLDLYLAALSSGLNALNFNHLREAKGIL